MRHGRHYTLDGAQARLRDAEARAALAEAAPGNGGGHPGDGEPGIGFWHELDAGYAGQRPL